MSVMYKLRHLTENKNKKKIKKYKNIKITFWECLKNYSQAIIKV